MAINKRRYINTKFWNDTYVSDLDPIEKLLFIYFLTNEHTNISGIYEVPIKVVALETGIDKTMIEKILPRLGAKVVYVGGMVVVKNFLKHQETKSDQTIKGILNCWEEIGIEKVKNLVDKGLYDIIGGSIEGAYRGHIGVSKYLDSNLDLDSNINTTEILSTKVSGSKKKKEAKIVIPEPWEKEDKIKWRDETIAKGRHGKLIIDYFIIKEMKFPTRLAANKAFIRFVKVAKEITDSYPDEQLLTRGLKRLKAEYKPDMWKLDTLIKILPTL